MRNKFKVEKSDGTTARFPKRWGADRVVERAPLEVGEWIKLKRWSRRKREWVTIAARTG